jgi:choline kinase
MSKISVGKTDVLILCGGLGIRFREVRDDIHKSLVPVQGTQFIDLLLGDLISLISVVSFSFKSNIDLEWRLPYHFLFALHFRNT